MKHVMMLLANSGDVGHMRRLMSFMPLFAIVDDGAADADSAAGADYFVSYAYICHALLMPRYFYAVTCFTIYMPMLFRCRCCYFRCQRLFFRYFRRLMSPMLFSLRYGATRFIDI